MGRPRNYASRKPSKNKGRAKKRSAKKISRRSRCKKALIRVAKSPKLKKGVRKLAEILLEKLIEAGLKVLTGASG